MAKIGNHGKQIIAASQEAYRSIRPEHEVIHAVLLAWARWLAVRWHPQSVKSLEGRYKPPPMYEEPIPENPHNLLLCHAVEKLIVNAPNNYGTHLRLWYVRRLPMEAAARKLNRAYAQAEPHLARAREHVMVHIKTT